MPPKRSNSNKLIRKTSSNNLYEATETEKNAISNMFKRIETSSVLKECDMCHEKIKSSQIKDHQTYKCSFRIKKELSLEQEIILIDDDEPKKEVLHEIKIEDNIKDELIERVCFPKRVKLDTDLVIHKELEGLTEALEDDDDKDKVESLDYYLKNFSNAIESVLGEDSFCNLFDQNDLLVIEKFNNLTHQAKVLYVRLFQRKFKWIPVDNINYERISHDLGPYINELVSNGFLINESSIESYDEIIYLFKAPQLKELSRVCHISNVNLSNKTELIRTILQHFKTQKSLKSHFFKKSVSDPTNDSSSSKPNYMIQCKKILGKCVKLERSVRSIFARVLILYSLSSSYQADPNNTGQQQLLQMLMVNMNNVKYMNYEIKLDTKIFQDKQSLLNYEQALDDEFELLSLLDSKEYDQAYDLFKDKIETFKSIILDPIALKSDEKLPSYLRSFTRGSVYTKILSVYAFEILQRLKKYNEANELFEFLLYKQNVYRLSTRSKWFERLAINYESHLKDPVKCFESIRNGLADKDNVIYSGRLTLYSRLQKMLQAKKYLKMKELKDELPKLDEKEKFEFIEAPNVEIEGTLLHTSEFIPGRKNVFIDTNSSPNKNGMTISVEQVAMNHYINVLGYTNGKHSETTTLTTLYGLLFWNIIWDNSVSNVFVDKFQHAPLDLQTKFFYKNRETQIEERLKLFRLSSIETICDFVTECWTMYNGYECYGVKFDLFESLEEFVSLVRCFKVEQLVSLCEYMSKNYRYCRSGGPDLILWSTVTNEFKFVEVKGPGDHLSYKQMIWLDFMIKNSIQCEVCHVKGLNSKRLRQ